MNEKPDVLVASVEFERYENFSRLSLAVIIVVSVRADERLADDLERLWLFMLPSLLDEKGSRDEEAVDREELKRLRDMASRPNM